MLLLIFRSVDLDAHQGYGIALDQSGNIYFTDIHRQTIWKLNQENQLEPLATQKWSHQLWLENDGSLLFTNEEEIDGKRAYSLWRLDNSGNLKQIIPPTLRPEFPNDIFVTDSNGNIYIASNDQIYLRNTSGKFEAIELQQKDSPNDKATFNGIRSMTSGSNGAIYLADGDAVKKIVKNEVETIASNLIYPDPVNIPIRNAPHPQSINRLFGLAIDEYENIFVAYFGNSQILRISNKSDVSIFYHSEFPWSPVGVAIDNQDLIVKEHAFVENKGWIGPRIMRVPRDGKAKIIFELKD